MKNNNIKITTFGGDDFTTVSEKALEVAQEIGSYGRTVEFEFNGVICLVNGKTYLPWLFRDYCNAHTMEWKTVGPDCKENYDMVLQADLDNRRLKEKEDDEKRQEAYRAQENMAKEALHEKIKDITMQFSNEAGWNEGFEKNSDPYGRCCYEYACDWAKLMQQEIAEKGVEVVTPEFINEISEKCQRQIDFYGITGFMYGAAVSILASTWIHGEAVRKWHNKEYGHEGDGVVNPAIITVGM